MDTIDPDELDWEQAVVRQGAPYGPRAVKKVVDACRLVGMVQIAEMIRVVGGERDRLDEGMEFAWSLIANAYGGNWDQADPDWREAAERWRDTWYHRRASNVVVATQKLRNKLAEIAAMDCATPHLRHCECVVCFAGEALREYDEAASHA